MADQRVAIGLGSNLGDREGQIRAAVGLLTVGGLRDVRLSTLHATTPVGCEPGAPEFLNAALTATSDLGPAALLGLCRQVERRLGRPSRHRRGGAYLSRPIDLDLLLVGDAVLDTPSLVLPHPGLRERVFVLQPLAEIAPDWRVPPDGQTVAQCLARLLAREQTEHQP
jgi:2-amino-4-hydroxy-6-hydroxymethyldihydropteridine diphosphokinase